MSDTTNNTDAIVLQLLAKVEDKKKQIGNAERPSWITNCSFGFDPSNNARINIQVVRELETLIEIHAFLTMKYGHYVASLLELGISEKEAPFRWLGFTYDNWVSDIKTRINGLQIKAKKDELAALEARVNGLVSPEQRRQIELAKLVAEIG
jgi:hypothetical protein